MENIDELPSDDDFDIITTSLKAALWKAGWSTDKVNQYWDTLIWSSNNENAIDQAVGILKNFGIDPDYYIKKYNQLLRAKRKYEQKLQEKKEIRKIVGKFNPMTIYENVEEFYKESPFFYDKNQIFWFWNKDRWKWEIVDDTDLLNMLENEFSMKGQIVTTTLLNKYVKAFQAIGRLNKPKEPEKYWIQFKDKVFDIKTKETFDVKPEYFFCNPLPFEIGKISDTPTMDKLFEDWVGAQFVKTLYEFIAYCCFRDYPIHSIFCMIGSGRNGKSSFLKILNKFIGQDNSCSTELDDLLESRFESAKLFKKLVCVMGETNFGTMSKTSLIKKLTGQDLIGFEYKNKMPFDDYNYAKIVVASNSLPVSTDTSEGFYRRWLILNFDNQFPEGKDIVDIIPETEYICLARKIIDLLPKLLNKGSFENQGTIEERKEKYILASNPFSKFVEEFCDLGAHCYVRNSELYNAYFEYLQATKKRTIKMRVFHQLLAEEGIEVMHTNRDGIDGRYAVGIALKSNWKDLISEKTTKTTKTTVITLNTYIQTLTEKTSVNSVNSVKKQEDESTYSIENI